MTTTYIKSGYRDVRKKRIDSHDNGNVCSERGDKKTRVVHNFVAVAT